MSDFKAKMHQNRFRRERKREGKGGEGENDLTYPCRKFLATPLVRLSYEKGCFY